MKFLNLRNLVSVLFAAASLCMCVSIFGADMKKEVPVVGSDGRQYELSKQQLAAFEKQALDDGNIEAAFRLYQYHWNFSMDMRQAMYWIQIGAENGDPRAQASLAGLMAYRSSHSFLAGSSTLDETTSRRFEMRAKFWEKKSKDLSTEKTKTNK